MAQLTDSTILKFLALGDSYTIGESVGENERWPVQFIQQRRRRHERWHDPMIIATTGWRTDNLKAAIEQIDPGSDFDLVSLLIGVNNFYQNKPKEEYRHQFDELLQTAIALAKGKAMNVIVLSIPDYGFTPFGVENQKTISEGIDWYNEINLGISIQRGVRYINITPISRKGLDQPELIAADGLHPSGEMYAQWVTLIDENLNRWSK